MVKAIVNAGICGFTVTIDVIRLSPRRVSVNITSDCEMVKEAGNELKELNWPSIFGHNEDLSFFKTAFKHIKHPACPVPMAIVKAIEVEAGLALPKDITIQLETKE